MKVSYEEMLESDKEELIHINIKFDVIMFVISLICLGILIAYGYNEIIFIILLISLFMQIIHRAGEKYE